MVSGMEIFRKDIQKSTIRLVAFIVNAERVSSAVAWIGILLVCTATFAYFASQSVILYLGGNVGVRHTKLSARPLEFPAVSVCNLNPYKSSLIKAKAPELYNAMGEHSNKIADSHDDSMPAKRRKRSEDPIEEGQDPPNSNIPVIIELQDPWAQYQPTDDASHFSRVKRQLAAGAPDGVGNKFYTAFIPNAGGSGTYQIMLATTSSTKFPVTITGSGGTFTTQTVNIDNAQVYSTNVATNPVWQGLRISAEYSFVAYTMEFVSGTADGTMLIPADVLDTDYLVMGVDYASTGQANINIVGTANNTNLTVTLPGGAVSMFVLNELDVQRLTYSIDTTGIRIKANKPVAVITGHTCTNFPVGCGSCDVVYEQMPPISTFGQTFALTPFIRTDNQQSPGCATNSTYDSKPYEFYKIMASQTDTTITVKTNATATDTYKLQTGEFVYALVVRSNYGYVKADKPVAVAHIMQGSSYAGTSSLGDPALQIVPPTSSYSRDYFLVTCNPTFTQHYITVTIDSTLASGLKLNGAAFIGPLIPNAIPGTSLVSYQYSFSCSGAAASYRITHDNSNAVYGVTAYGYAASVSYAYTVGRMFGIYSCTPTTTNPADGLDNDCDAWIDEEVRNFEDDDGDGKIDEDLMFQIPVIAAPDDYEFTACNASKAPAPINGSVPSIPLATVDPKCLPYNLTYMDNATGDSCAATITRTWRMIDKCGNIADNVTHAITMSLTPDNYTAPLTAYLNDTAYLTNSNLTGIPKANTSCAKAQMFNYTYEDTFVTETHVSRTWTVTPLCGENSMKLTQDIMIMWKSTTTTTSTTTSTTSTTPRTTTVPTTTTSTTTSTTTTTPTTSTSTTTTTPTTTSTTTTTPTTTTTTTPITTRKKSTRIMPTTLSTICTETTTTTTTSTTSTTTVPTTTTTTSSTSTSTTPTTTTATTTTTTPRTTTKATTTASTTLSTTSTTPVATTSSSSTAAATTTSTVPSTSTSSTSSTSATSSALTTTPSTTKSTTLSSTTSSTKEATTTPTTTPKTTSTAAPSTVTSTTSSTTLPFSSTNSTTITWTSPSSSSTSISTSPPPSTTVSSTTSTPSLTSPKPISSTSTVQTTTQAPSTTSTSQSSSTTSTSPILSTTTKSTAIPTTVIISKAPSFATSSSTELTSAPIVITSALTTNVMESMPSTIAESSTSKEITTSKMSTSTESKTSMGTTAETGSSTPTSTAERTNTETTTEPSASTSTTAEASTSTAPSTGRSTSTEMSSSTSSGPTSTTTVPTSESNPMSTNQRSTEATPTSTTAPSTLPSTSTIFSTSFAVTWSSAITTVALTTSESSTIFSSSTSQVDTSTVPGSTSSAVDSTSQRSTATSVESTSLVSSTEAQSTPAQTTSSDSQPSTLQQSTSIIGSTSPSLTPADTTSSATATWSTSHSQTTSPDSTSTSAITVEWSTEIPTTGSEQSTTSTETSVATSSVTTFFATSTEPETSTSRESSSTAMSTSASDSDESSGISSSTMAGVISTTSTSGSMSSTESDLISSTETTLESSSGISTTTSAAASLAQMDSSMETASTSAETSSTSSSTAQGTTTQVSTPSQPSTPVSTSTSTNAGAESVSTTLQTSSVASGTATESATVSASTSSGSGSSAMETTVETTRSTTTSASSTTGEFTDYYPSLSTTPHASSSSITWTSTPAATSQDTSMGTEDTTSVPHTKAPTTGARSTIRSSSIMETSSAFSSTSAIKTPLTTEDPSVPTVTASSGRSSSASSASSSNTDTTSSFSTTSNPATSQITTSQGSDSTSTSSTTAQKESATAVSSSTKEVPSETTRTTTDTTSLSDISNASTSGTRDTTTIQSTVPSTSLVFTSSMSASFSPSANSSSGSITAATTYRAAASSELSSSVSESTSKPSSSTRIVSPQLPSSDVSSSAPTEKPAETSYRTATETVSSSYQQTNNFSTTTSLTVLPHEPSSTTSTSFETSSPSPIEQTSLTPLETAPSGISFTSIASQPSCTNCSTQQSSLMTVAADPTNSRIPSAESTLDMLMPSSAITDMQTLQVTQNWQPPQAAPEQTYSSPITDHSNEPASTLANMAQSVLSTETPAIEVPPEHLISPSAETQNAQQATVEATIPKKEEESFSQAIPEKASAVSSAQDLILQSADVATAGPVLLAAPTENITAVPSQPNKEDSSVGQTIDTLPHDDQTTKLQPATNLPDDQSGSSRVPVTAKQEIKAPSDPGNYTPIVIPEKTALSASSQMGADLPYLIFSMITDPKDLAALGYTYEEMVFLCKFNNRPCDVDTEIKTYFDPNYGNCFTFNHEPQTHYSTRAGDQLGLQIIFNTPSNDYLPFVFPAGYKIALHDPDEEAIMDLSGLTCSPGMDYSFAVEKSAMTKMGASTNPCATNTTNGIVSYYQNKSYTIDTCLATCYQRQVINICGCGDPHYAVPEGVRYCNLTQKACADKFADSAAEFMSLSTCGCLPACKTTMYDIVQTKAQWQMPPFVPRLCRERPPEEQELCLTGYKRNYSKINIYYSSLSSVVLEEYSSYSPTLLFSDLSASFGLWLGFCMISFAELIIFPVMSVHHHVWNWKR